MRQSLIFFSISIALLLVFSCAPAGDDTTTDSGTPPPAANGDTDGTPVSDENGNVDEPVADEPEGLFDYYSKPADWPVDVPFLSGYTFYEYENSEEGLHAFA